MAIELGVGYLSVLPSTDKLAPAIRKEWQQVNKESKKYGDEGGKGYGSGFKSGIQGLGIAAAGAVAGIVALGKSAIDLEADFSQTMNVTAATLQAPQKEIRKLTDLALDLGANTSFSASEVAGAMQELAKAGLDTATISSGALAGTLELAAAGGTSLENAATIASNAMNTFNIEGDRMGDISAALAGGANASTASVESLGYALSQVGPGAVTAGLSLNDTVGALAAFDNAGIKGSDAGTSLKTMLTRLVPQTDKAAGAMKDLGLKFTDAQGQFLPLTEIAQQLQDSFKGLSDAEKTTALNEIFGSDAARAASVLAKEGASGLQTYIDATLDAGAASEAANARMKGTAGAVEELGGAWETLQLRIGKGLAPAVEWVSEKLGGLMDFLGRNINTVMIVVGVIGALAAGILALNAAFIVASAATNAWTVITGVARGVMVVATAAQWAFNAAMSANPIGLVIAGIAALVAGLVWFFTKTELGQKIIKNVWSGIKSAIGGVVDWFQGTALPALQTAWDAIVTAAGVVWDVMKDVWGGIVKAAQGAWTVLKIIYVTAATAFTLWWQGMTWAWNTFGKPIWDAIVTAANWVGDQLGIAFDWMADKFAIFGGKVQGFYLKWIKPTWDAIVNAFRSAWNWIDANVIKPFQLGLRIMGLAVRYLWLRYVVPAFNGIKNALGSAWNWIKRTIFDAWNRALTALGRAWQWLNTKVIQPAWRGIRTAASTAWNWIRSNVFTPFGKAIDAIGKAFRKVGDVIGKAWGKIKEAAAKPVNFVIETVYMKGIKGTWDKIAGSVGLDLKLPTVNPIRFANGSEDHRAQIARPGAMRLWAEPETGGEAYIPLAKSKRGRSTAILGAVARKFGYSLNKYADGGIAGAVGDIGKKVLDFFTDPASVFKGALDKLKGFGGGAVGKIAGALPGKIIDAIIDKAKSFGGGGRDVALSGGGRFAGGPVMGWQNMWNIVKNAFPGATLNSAFRPGAITAVGTKSFHGQGRAIDVTPSMAIFNWLAKTFPNSSELIYSPAGRRQLYMGRQTMFGEPTRGDHWDHVHWAMANGGMLFDQGGMMKHNTVGVNKSGKAEAVLTNRETKAYQAVARNMATMAAGAATSNTYRADGGRKRMTLVVGGREFDAYVAEVAEDVYDAEKGFERRTGRMR